MRPFALRICCFGEAISIVFPMISLAALSPMELIRPLPQLDHCGWRVIRASLDGRQRRLGTSRSPEIGDGLLDLRPVACVENE